MSWSSGLFDCFTPIGTCCLGSWCPCMLHGRTQEKRDNPNSDSIGCNGPCMGFCCLSLCQLQWFLQFGSRQKTRRRHNIKGSAVTDCLVSTFCGCCGLIQEDKEVRTKKSGDGEAGGAQGYKPIGQMQYGDDDDA